MSLDKRRDGIATNGTCAVSNTAECDAKNMSSADSLRLLALCATEALAGEWGDGMMDDAAPASSKWRSEGKWLRLKKVSRSLAGDEDTRVAVMVGEEAVVENSDVGSKNMYRRHRWKPFGRICNALRHGRIEPCEEGTSSPRGMSLGNSGGVKGGRGAYPSKDKLLNDGR